MLFKKALIHVFYLFKSHSHMIHAVLYFVRWKSWKFRNLFEVLVYKSTCEDWKITWDSRSVLLPDKLSQYCFCCLCVLLLMFTTNDTISSFAWHHVWYFLMKVHHWAAVKFKEQKLHFDCICEKSYCLIPYRLSLDKNWF